MWSVRDGRALASEASAVALVAAVVTVSTLPSSSRPDAAVLSVAAGQVLVAIGAWVLCWTGHLAVLTRLWLPIVLLLGAGAWASDSHAAVLGPLYVLVFAWIGMRTPQSDMLVAVPVAAASYAGGLVAGGAPAHVVGSTLILVPVCVAVSLLISTRVRAQRRLRNELEARDRWRAALMATLAHDVRSPLSTVAGTLEILQEDPAVPERYGRLVEAASRQTTRILKLAHGLLDIERVDDGQLVLDLALQPVAPIADQVADLTDPARVRVDIDPGLVAYIDAQRMEQVLYNLVNNAFRHGRPPVVISAVPGSEGVQITVSDHGDGVPPDDVPQLFERFSSSDHAPGSVGLGLWIVHTFITAHGGSVRYEDAPNGGARFVLLLPPGPGRGYVEERPHAGQADRVTR